ncbi:hypothetical protein WME79_30050 [Sorangium sp. So ce726]|uniref:hypothetical protein n=1 Tax=Sorangium sp. So ce726 TaxID=3133319 RepID=UPI003F5F157B
MIERSGDAYALRAGAYTFVHVENGSESRVYVTVVDLGEGDWSIVPMMPLDPSMGSYIAMETGAHLWFAIEAMLRSGSTSGVDVIKVFATNSDTDFWWLLHPPIDQPITRSLKRRVGAAQDTLFRLREALDADENKERAFRVVPQPGFDWNVLQIHARIG